MDDDIPPGYGKVDEFELDDAQRTVVTFWRGERGRLMVLLHHFDEPFSYASIRAAERRRYPRANGYPLLR